MSIENVRGRLNTSNAMQSLLLILHGVESECVRFCVCASPRSNNAEPSATGLPRDRDRRDDVAWRCEPNGVQRAIFANARGAATPNIESRNFCAGQHEAGNLQQVGLRHARTKGAAPSGGNNSRRKSARHAEKSNHFLIPRDNSLASHIYKLQCTTANTPGT